jgi:two-component sensor histidine kinase/HAMP domain-containing protein
MRISTKLRTNTLLSLALGLVVVGTVVYAAQSITAATRTEEVADRIVKGAAELDSITYYYFFRPDERPRVQWERRHASLGDLLHDGQFGAPGERIIIEGIRANHEALRSLFAQLVASLQARDPITASEPPLSLESRERLMTQFIAKTQAISGDAFLLSQAANENIRAVLRTSVAVVLASVALLVLAVGAGSSLVAGTVTRALRRLQESTRRIADGALHHRIGMVSRDEFGDLARSFDQMTGQLQAVTVSKEALQREVEERTRAEADNVALLREVHHRVKNNLQMLCDMLYLQMEGIADADKAAVLRDTYGRIYAIARLHEQLYRAMYAGRVALAGYLGRLVAGFEELYSVPVKLEVFDAGLDLDVDRAIHVGLIVNELVTNAMKHAFPEGARGEVCVGVRRFADDLELRVGDNGTGLPQDLDLEHTRSLGLRIVRILGKRLHATLSVENHGGATFAIRFPLYAEAALEPPHHRERPPTA